MQRDNRIIFARVYGLAGPAFRVFDRLISGHRNAGHLLAAAREISYAASRRDGTHAALKQLADRTYRKHGIPTAPLWQGEGVNPTMAEEGEVSVEEGFAFRRSPIGDRRSSGESRSSGVSAKAGFGSL